MQEEMRIPFLKGVLQFKKLTAHAAPGSRGLAKQK
jgi:hypothetical protein